MACVIGIDIGTTGCKLLALKDTGTILGSVTEGYPLYQPREGWSEQDPEDWHSAVLKGLKTLRAALGGEEIRGISFSGQMHGMVALDGKNRVVRRAILWNDQRTEAQCEEITTAAGGVDHLLKYTDNLMLTGYTGGKILWMREQEPEHFEKTALILNPKDYIRFRLTGNVGAEVSDASGTGLFDVEKRVWCLPLMERIGLSAGLFPEAKESTDPAGFLLPEIAAETGIPSGIPVYYGGGDAVISVAGMGLRPGHAGVTLGTSGVVAAGFDHFMKNPEGALQVFCGNTAGKWVAFGCTLAAAGSYQWFLDRIANGVSFRELDAAAAEVPAGSEGLLYLPYLFGERCPIFDVQARGSFTGITARMGIGHFARAVLEGVAFSQKQVYNLMGAEGGELVVAGGGAKSLLWRQILADVFHMPVRTVSGSAEGGAFGAALIAGTGCGVWSSLDEAMEIIRPESETLPNPADAEVYREAFDRYCGLYGALKPFYH